VTRTTTPLVFGLAVLPLTEEPGQLRLDLPTKLHAVRRASAKGTPKKIPSVLFGDPQGELLLDIGDPE
jgi:hypothetical protein